MQSSRFFSLSPPAQSAITFRRRISLSLPTSLYLLSTLRTTIARARASTFAHLSARGSASHRLPVSTLNGSATAFPLRHAPVRGLAQRGLASSAKWTAPVLQELEFGRPAAAFTTASAALIGPKATAHLHVGQIERIHSPEPTPTVWVQKRPASTHLETRSVWQPARRAMNVGHTIRAAESAMPESRFAFRAARLMQGHLEDNSEPPNPYYSRHARGAEPQ